MIFNIGLTKKEIAANSLLYLVAGFENNSATLSLVIHCLATNPEVQERLQALGVYVDCGERSVIPTFQRMCHAKLRGG